MNENTIILHLYARDAGPDMEPLPQALAYVDVSPVDDDTCGFNVHRNEGGRILAGMLDLDGELDTDPKAEHLLLPRYELLDARDATATPTPPWATIVATVMSDTTLTVEVSSPGWLTEAARNGVSRVLAALFHGETA